MIEPMECENHVLRYVFDRSFPERVDLVVRNCNKITVEDLGLKPGGDRLSVYVSIPSCGVYWMGADLASIMSPKLIKALKDASMDESNPDGRTVYAQAFLGLAHEIANEFNRPVHVTHQYGGNMEYAEYENYGPFLPHVHGPVSMVHSGPAFLG